MIFFMQTYQLQLRLKIGFLWLALLNVLRPKHILLLFAYSMTINILYHQNNKTKRGIHPVVHLLVCLSAGNAVGDAMCWEEMVFIRKYQSRHSCKNESHKKYTSTSSSSSSSSTSTSHVKIEFFFGPCIKCGQQFRALLVSHFKHRLRR